KRRQLAEAAEKRQMEASSRGIKNVYSVEQKKKKQEEIEKRIAASGSGGEGGLRVSLKKKQHDTIVQVFIKKMLVCHPQD
ncbi:PREDICTED: small VCP/p97-interacting protein, partial [Apaloderma vittatum]|uniref:small VCP/p97-interacting protein n=1 Tax=Apaloderma vittatum TaxID=57397 RepID=UPI000521303A